MNKDEKTFLHGIICALVEVNRNDMPTVCARVLSVLGYDTADIKKQNLPEYEAEHIKPILKELKDIEKRNKEGR